MAKIIKLTDEILAMIREDFAKELGKMRLSDGKITYIKSLTAEKAEAVIRFTEPAWFKMQALIREYDKEVAWHGLVQRGEDDTKNEYIISDILIYPQKVTGATVETDQAEYQKWIISKGPEVISKIRMQGHSHVNMGTTPSGTDTGYYREILDQLPRDAFYIFMIWNKRGEKTILLYDMRKNLLFETADCKIVIEDGEVGIQKLLDEAKQMVKDRVWTTPATYTWNKKDEPKQVPAVTNPAPAAAETKKEEKTEPKVPSVPSVKQTKKGKRKGKRPAYIGQCSLYGSAYYDDPDDDPNGPFGWRDSWR